MDLSLPPTVQTSYPMLMTFKGPSDVVKLYSNAISTYNSIAAIYNKTITTYNCLSGDSYPCIKNISVYLTSKALYHSSDSLIKLILQGVSWAAAPLISSTKNILKSETSPFGMLEKFDDELMKSLFSNSQILKNSNEIPCRAIPFSSTSIIAAAAYMIFFSNKSLENITYAKDRIKILLSSEREKKFIYPVKMTLGGGVHHIQAFRIEHYTTFGLFKDVMMSGVIAGTWGFCSIMTALGLKNALEDAGLDINQAEFVANTLTAASVALPILYNFVYPYISTKTLKEVIVISKQKPSDAKHQLRRSESREWKWDGNEFRFQSQGKTKGNIS